MTPGEAYTMWRRIAVIRREEGDTAGSKQAAANARIFANRNADGTIRPPRYRIPKRIAGYVESSVQTDVDRYACDAPTVPLFEMETATSTATVEQQIIGKCPVVSHTTEEHIMAKTVSPERQGELDFLGTIATSSLTALPEHEFKSGSKGRNASGKITVDGVEYTAFFTLVNRATIVKASEPVAEPVVVAEPVTEPVVAKSTRKTAAQRKAEKDAASV